MPHGLTLLWHHTHWACCSALLHGHTGFLVPGKVKAAHGQHPHFVVTQIWALGGNGWLGCVRVGRITCSKINTGMQRVPPPPPHTHACGKPYSTPHTHTHTHTHIHTHRRSRAPEELVRRQEDGVLGIKRVCKGQCGLLTTSVWGTYCMISLCVALVPSTSNCANVTRCCTLAPSA